MEITKGEYMIFIELSLNIFSLKDCFFRAPRLPLFFGGRARERREEKKKWPLILYLSVSREATYSNGYYRIIKATR